jgi:hypothetical protein
MPSITRLSSEQHLALISPPIPLNYNTPEGLAQRYYLLNRGILEDPIKGPHGEGHFLSGVAEILLRAKISPLYRNHLISQAQERVQEGWHSRAAISRHLRRDLGVYRKSKKFLIFESEETGRLQEGVYFGRFWQDVLKRERAGKYYTGFTREWSESTGIYIPV